MMRMKLGIPKSIQKLDFWQRQSSEVRRFVNDPILEIWGRLRPSNLASFRVAKNQLLNALGYILNISFLILQRSIYAQAPIPQSLQTRLDQIETKIQSTQHYNPPANAVSGIIIDGDVLYWQAREGGLPYALQTPNPLSAFEEPDNLFKSHVKQLQYDWDFGARVSLGLQFRRDGWALCSTWTHFDTKAEDTGFNNTSQTFTPLWGNPEFIHLLDSAKQAKARWHLFHNEIDLSLSRPSYISRFFILKPEIGASAVSIKQHFHIDYTRTIFPGASQPRLTNNFQGAGVLVGLDTRFALGSGWSIFNLTRGELYFGKFHIHSKETYTTEPPAPEQKEWTLRNDFYRLCPALQMEMGFRWERTFSQERHAFVAKLAYEYQIFFYQNQFPRILNNNPPLFAENQGDLTLSGGTFSLCFTF